MASLEKPKIPTEKELKLAKVEGEFYKTCNAVRCEGIEFENVRNFLLRELLEIEEKKTSQLRQEIQEIQVCLCAWYSQCLWCVLFGMIIACMAEGQRDNYKIETRAGGEFTTRDTPHYCDSPSFSHVPKDATIGRTLSDSTPTRSAKLNALAILQTKKPPKLPRTGPSKGMDEPVSSATTTLGTSTDSPTANPAVTDDLPAMGNDHVVDNDPLSPDSTNDHVIANVSVPAVVDGNVKLDESAKNLGSNIATGTTSTLPSRDVRIEQESLVVQIDLKALGSRLVSSKLKVQDDVAPRKRGRPSTKKKKVESTKTRDDPNTDCSLPQGDSEPESGKKSECEGKLAPILPRKRGRPLKRPRENSPAPKASVPHRSEDDPVASSSISQAVLELDSRGVAVMSKASHPDNTVVMPISSDQSVDNNTTGQLPLMATTATMASLDKHSATVSRSGSSVPLDPKPSEVGHVISKPEIALTSSAIVPRKKGRPPKKQARVNISEPVLNEADSKSIPVPSEEVPGSESIPVPSEGVPGSKSVESDPVARGIVPKKRPGRPSKKHKDPLTNALSKTSNTTNTDKTMESVAPKKRGRPRKLKTTDIHVVKSPNSRGDVVMAKSSEAEPVPLKPEAEPMPEAVQVSNTSDHKISNTIAPAHPPRKRGRPRKQLGDGGTSAAIGLSSDSGRHPDIPAVGHVIPKLLEAAVLPPKKRGRPPKRQRINEMAPVVKAITDNLIPPAKKIREALGDPLVQSPSDTHSEQSTATPTPTALREPSAVVSEDHTPADAKEKEEERGEVREGMIGAAGVIQDVTSPYAGEDNSAHSGEGGMVVGCVDSATDGGVVDGGEDEMEVGVGVDIPEEGEMEGGEVPGVGGDGEEGVNSEMQGVDNLDDAVEGDGDILMEGHKDGGNPGDTVKPNAIGNDAPDAIVDNKTSNKSNLKLKMHKASASHSAPPPPLKSTDMPRIRGRPPKQRDAVPLVGAKKGNQLKRTNRNPENSSALPFYGGSLSSDSVQQQSGTVTEEGKPLPTTAKPSQDAEEDTPVLSPPSLPLGRPRREQATRRQDTEEDTPVLSPPSLPLGRPRREQATRRQDTEEDTPVLSPPSLPLGRPRREQATRRQDTEDDTPVLSPPSLPLGRPRREQATRRQDTEDDTPVLSPPSLPLGRPRREQATRRQDTEEDTPVLSPPSLPLGRPRREQATRRQDTEEDTPVLSPPSLPLGRPRREQATRRQDTEEDTPVLSPPSGRPRREQATRRHVQAQAQELDRRDFSPEIPLQDTNLTLSLPISTLPSSRKVKKRKTLESVLSTLLESKLSRNGEVSPSERRENSRAVRNVVEKGQKLAEDLKKRKRKTLAKSGAKGRAELSVVGPEVSICGYLWVVCWSLSE